MSASSAVAVPAHMLPHRSPAELLRLARDGIAEAATTGPDGLRYATAHLAALRAAAAMLAVRAVPAPGRRSRMTSVWALLTRVAPDLGEWAAFFAAGAARRAAAEAGIPRVVSAREADDQLRAAQEFTGMVEAALGRGAVDGVPAAPSPVVPAATVPPVAGRAGDDRPCSRPAPRPGLLAAAPA